MKRQLDLFPSKMRTVNLAPVRTSLYMTSGFRNRADSYGQIVDGHVRGIVWAEHPMGVSPHYTYTVQDRYIFDLGNGYALYAITDGDMIRPKRAEPRVVTASLPSIKYIGLIDSINSPKPADPSKEELDRVDLWQTNPKLAMKRPKVPVLRRLHWKPLRLPVYKPLAETDLEPIKAPKFSNPSKRVNWVSLTLPQIIARRRELINRVNERRLNRYKSERAIYDKQINRRRELELLQTQLYQKRMERYLTRKQRFDELERKSKQRTVRQSRKHALYRENPYRLLRLHGDDRTYSNGTISVAFDSTDPFRTATYPRIAHWVQCQELLSDRLAKKEFAEQIVESVWAEIARILPLCSTHLEDKCIRKLFSSISAQKVHIGNIIAERAQTLELLVTTWLRVKDLILLKKGLLKQTAKLAKNPKQWANEVLAFKFGVEPLIGDIQACLKLLETGMGDFDLVFRKNASEMSVHADSGTTFKGRTTVSYVLKYDVSHSLPKMLNELGLIDPTQILWEVTPWSFVVDWFIPVGDWIESLTADCGLSFRTGTLRRSLKGEFTFEDPVVSYAPGTVSMTDPTGMKYTVGAPTGTYAGEFSARDVLIDAPDRNRILRFKSPLSWSHGIEAVALFTQQLRKI